MPPIRQRADLLVRNQTAVEFQCSPISAAQLTKRTENYKGLGLDTIWIKGTEEHPEEGIQILRLSAYEQAMLRKRRNHHYLLLLLPEKNRFFYYSNLFFVSGNRWIGKGKYLSAEQQAFPFATPRHLSKREFQQAWLLFLDLRRQFIRSQFYAKNRFQSIFWRSCYELRLEGGNLPDHIGLPFWQSENIAQHAVLWQLQALIAQREGITMSALVTSGKLPVKDNVNHSEVVQLLENYLKLCLLLEKNGKGQSVDFDVLYDFYCQNL